MKKIISEQDIINCCSQGKTEFFVVLNFGLKSSKTIIYESGIFYIYHDSSNFEEEVKHIADSDISEALNLGALYCYQ